MLPTATTANKIMTRGNTRNSPVSATPTVMEDGGYFLDFQVVSGGICLFQRAEPVRHVKW
jgi:hypothetical protein